MAELGELGSTVTFKFTISRALKVFFTCIRIPFSCIHATLSNRWAEQAKISNLKFRSSIDPIKFQSIES